MLSSDEVEYGSSSYLTEQGGDADGPLQVAARRPARLASDAGLNLAGPGLGSMDGLLITSGPSSNFLRLWELTRTWSVTRTRRISTPPRAPNNDLSCNGSYGRSYLTLRACVLLLTVGTVGTVLANALNLSRGSTSHISQCLFVPAKVRLMAR